MSLSDTTLADFSEEQKSEEQIVDDIPERPAWNPTDTPERTCQSCGRKVTKQFQRVFGDNDDQVFGCFDCMSATDVKLGAAKDPYFEGRVQPSEGHVASGGDLR